MNRWQKLIILLWAVSFAVLSVFVVPWERKAMESRENYGSLAIISNSPNHVYFVTNKPTIYGSLLHPPKLASNIDMNRWLLQLASLTVICFVLFVLCSIKRSAA